MASDHSPILVDTDPVTFKLAKPYKYYRGWLKHKEYKSFVQNCWTLNSLENDSDVVKILESISKDFKYWNKHILKNIFKNKEMIIKKIDQETGNRAI